MAEDRAIIEARNLSVFYGQDCALDSMNMAIARNVICGIIGPAGAGKTSFLRTLNRLNDLNAECRIEGSVLLSGENIYRPGYDVIRLRRAVGMLFALPVALPMSIYDNVAYGPGLVGGICRTEMDELVENSLKAAFLWDEVKDRLAMSGLRLSGGQQQRLCLARTLAMRPEVVLLDEPCSGLDPISTARIEEALTLLKSRYTIVLVTNNTKQAARIADYTAFFLMGEMVEYGVTSEVFTMPRDKRTSDYVTGRFG